VPEADDVIEAGGELFARYVSAIAEHGWFFAIVAAILLANLLRHRLSLRAQRWVRLGFVAAVGVAGAVYAWSLIWASDDAYISFRYAENLALGRGLVWNPGERVEGYTDFLWTVIMAAFIRAGADPGHAGILLSLLSFGLVIVMAARFPARLTAQPLLFGPAPLLCALHYTTASFATSGLETMFGTMLTLFAVERVQSGRPLAGGTAATLATMTHPDHAIFYAALGVAIALDRRTRRDLVRYAAPFAVLFVPYFLWRWSYYGDFMPNTYYAKSGGDTYFEQGIIYVLATFVGGGLVFALPLAVVGAYEVRKTVTGRFAWIGLPMYVVYVAKIGGDFMYGRLFVPVLVITFVLADVGFRLLVARDLRPIAAALVAVAALPSLPVRILNAGEIFHGVADERSFTPITNFSKMISAAGAYVLGRSIDRRLNWPGEQPMVGLHNIGMAGYYGKVPIFDLRGLTSRSVAHLPIRKRGRPGHEKLASPGHAVEGGVVLSQEPVYPPPYGGLTQVEIDAFSFFLVHYEPTLVRKLTGRGARVVAPERLEGLLSTGIIASPETLACHLWFLREYYFASNLDPARRDRVAKTATAVDAETKPVESLLLESREPSVLGYVPVRSITPSPHGPEWTATGDAARWTNTPLLPDQGLTIGRTGPIVFTSTERDLDDSAGSLTSEPFAVEGDVITFKVAGGMDLRSLTVSLVVDGKPERRATGCRSEWLGTRVWDVKPFRGRKATIVVTDDSRGDYGHLVVGTITEWREPP
jgi:hypothetical protein